MLYRLLFVPIKICSEVTTTKMWIYFYLFILCSIHKSMSQCETESFQYYENNITTPIKWASEINTTVPSICLHENNTLVERVCMNSKWSPVNTPHCKKIQKTFMPKCRNGDEEYNKDWCIYLIPPNPKSPQTPDVIIEKSINDTLIIAKSVKNITEVWLPVIRLSKYGKFVWTYPYLEKKNNIYQHPLLKENNYQNNTYKHGCIAATNITVTKKNGSEYNVEYIPKIVNCNNHISTIFVYKKVNRYFVSNNKTENNGSPIFYSTKGNKAFYIHKKCKKIAEPRYEEDNFLIKNLIQNETCRIGIKYAKNISNFVWESTNEIINYTDWIIQKQYHHHQVVINASGWSLNDSKFIKCYICEIDRSDYVTDLILTKKGHNKLMLIAYSFDILYYSIVCRVDVLDDMQYNITKKRISVHNEFNSNYNRIEALRSRTVWELKISSSDSILEYNYIYCVGSLFPNGNDIKTDSILYGQTTGPEFAFELTLKDYCMHFNCDLNLDENFSKTIFNELKFDNMIATRASTSLNLNETNFSENTFNKLKFEKIISTRAIKILNINETNGDIDLLCHIESKKDVDLFFFYSEFKRIVKEQKLLNYKNLSVNINLNSIKSCEGCLPNTTTVNNVSLQWHFTKINRTAINKNCIQTNYLPVTRKCIGNFLHGGTWMNVSGTCDNRMQKHEVSQQLDILEKDIEKLTVTKVANKLANLTQNSNILHPTDIITISDIFKKIKSNLTDKDNIKKLAKDISKTISNLMATNYTSLKILSNEVRNTTNEILDSTESIMENITKHMLNENGVAQQVESNFMYQLLDPFVENITGIALIRPKTTNKNPPFTDYTTLQLTADYDIKRIIEIENLEAAAFIPRMLFDEISRKKESNKSIKINMIFYYNDSFFIENDNIHKVVTKVFSISISGYDNLFSSRIPVIFKNFRAKQTNEMECAYWDFEKINRWKIDNTALSEYQSEKHIQICYFSHLTQFALLLGVAKNNTEFINVNILSVMTSIGSILSVFGIFVIFITAALFKSWLKMTGTKIVLNISICILLQIVLLHVNSQANDIACKITGSLLHYSVLCGFMWSLIMAYLQYWRFVKILGNTTSHIVLKALFFGWVLPIIPVAIILSIDSTVYISKEQTDNSICYPSGTILYTTVHLPVGIIILINSVLFSYIIYKVHTQTKAMANFRYNYDEAEMRSKEIKLGVFLFFSLSLCWIFGLLASTQYCDICTYMFVATSTSQGFILFVYYVLFNKDVRFYWKKLIKPKKKMSTSTAITLTASKSNETNEMNKTEINYMKQKNKGNLKNKFHQFNNMEETPSDSNTYMYTLNQDELRKRVKMEKDNTTKSGRKQNFYEQNYEQIQNDIESSDTLKSSKNLTGNEATTNKIYNSESLDVQ